MLKQTFLACLLIWAGAVHLFAQTPVGKWKTVDDETGETKSIVEIYEQQGKLYGKIVKLIDPPEPNPVCEECTDHRKGQKILGMVILENMEKEENEWNGGKILDPENGKTYRCKIWLENKDQLNVRGYVAFLYRTQSWYRVEGE
ncbi:DUF2147 domain-containing protein [Rapidithrix thailandica]|uniref:DUF2147 domain-containing protein n=1 Tax=Rapidithrix thailandica TaxID=413964 RepID=A0AAW9SAZ1_9BACT